jgi:hypothetical protein
VSKSVLAIDTPENCYDCPFGTAYCGKLEYVGYCELADCLDYDVILMTEEHYDYESKSRPEWCPLKPLPEKKEEEYWRSKLSLAWIRGWNTCISKIKGGNADG